MEGFRSGKDVFDGSSLSAFHDPNRPYIEVRSPFTSRVISPVPSSWRTVRRRPRLQNYFVFVALACVGAGIGGGGGAVGWGGNGPGSFWVHRAASGFMVESSTEVSVAR